MRGKIVEVTNFFNWGKFLLSRFEDSEWAVPSRISEYERSLVAGRGWDRQHVFVLDLQTGEGALFRPGGSAKHDLEKHSIWVCPMYPVFLAWFYKHPEHWTDLETLPSLLELTDEEAMAASALYRPRQPLSRADVAAEIVADLREQTNPGGVTHDLAACIERDWVYGDKGKDRGKEEG